MTTLWSLTNYYFTFCFHLSFGLAPANPLTVPPIVPNTSANTSLQVTAGTGGVLKMEPLTMVQVAVKNNVDVFYFGTVVPMHVFFTEDGAMGKFRLELAVRPRWKLVNLDL